VAEERYRTELYGGRRGSDGCHRANHRADIMAEIEADSVRIGPQLGEQVIQVLKWGSRHTSKKTASQPRRFGEIDQEPVAFPLVASGHFGAGVA
jgi:hypothetical protein